MLPKRKLIKKQFVAPETSPTEAPTSVSTGDLIEQLHSTDLKIKGDAISAIANLQVISSELQEELYTAETLGELARVLTTAGNTWLVQTALFAINNLCVSYNESQMRTVRDIVEGLFKIGLDKALMGLDSTNVHLIKPVLILMGTMAEYIPEQYQFLVVALQNNIVAQWQKYLKQQNYIDLVIEFLIKSNYTLTLPSPATEIPKQQQKCLQILQNIAQVDRSYKNRAMASKLLISMTLGQYKQPIHIFCTVFEEFLSDIDLEKEYVANFANKGQEEEEIGDEDQDQQEEQEEENGMVEEKKKANTNANSKTKFAKKIEQQQEPQTPYNIFIDALEGIQVLLQFMVQQLQQQTNFEQQEQQDQQMQQQQAQSKPKQLIHKQLLLAALQQTLTTSIKNLHKYTHLSFIEGQNIIQLILRLMIALPDTFLTRGNQPNKISIIGIVGLVEEIIVAQFKYEMAHPRGIPEEVFIFNANAALQAILKYKIISNRDIYVELPYIKYQNTTNNSNGNGNKSIISVTNKWKQFWLSLLQLYSLFYNPQKTPTVTQSQNTKIGTTLKQLIIQIPQIQLEEWRGQAIDTLFDVYSNENFDGVFMGLGFVQVLGQVLKVASGGSGAKMGKKSKNTNKFVAAVIADIERFLAYKKKMIGF